MQKVTIVEQMLNLGLWDTAESGKYLNTDPAIIKRAQEEKKKRDEELRSDMLRQNLENDKNVQREPDAKLKAQKKQTTQNSNQTNAGGKKINP